MSEEIKQDQLYGHAVDTKKGLLEDEYTGEEDVQDEDDVQDAQWPPACNVPLHFLPQGKQRSKPVMLASFPGSGNTWLRYLIEQGNNLSLSSFFVSRPPLSYSSRLNRTSLL